MDLACRICSIHPKDGEIALFWLGQAGFVIKDGEGRLIAVDPYLTDCVERAFGFKRMIPKIIAPYELEPDILIATHDHLDHLDADAVPILMANGKTRLIGSVTAVNKCLDMGLDKNRLIAMKPGDQGNFCGIAVEALPADHGELAPDALGILLTLEGTRIYFTGDTAYGPEIVKAGEQSKPDVIILPINGEYGNLNSEEAALLARDVGAKTAVPCHFWTFMEHRGDPQEFAAAMKRHAPGCGVKFLCQGEMAVIKKGGLK